MQQEQLKRELEEKRIQEEELLRKMKEEKTTAYMKYLKDNSKEILQNFKKKDPNGGPSNPEDAKNLKKAPLAPINYAKNKPTSAEPLPVKSSRQKMSGISNNKNQMKPASANSNLDLPRVREVPQERQETPPENNNLNALDLDFNRSGNNFRKIIDQYHKEMKQLKTQQDQPAIPLQQFYDAQAQQYLPAPPSKLLESLDLSSSLTKWSPSKPLDPTYEPFWQVEEPKPKKKVQETNETGKYGNYGGYGIQNHREEARKKFQEEEEDKEEVDEIIEPIDDDSMEEYTEKASNVSSNLGRRNIERKKLVKASEVSQKDLKNNWHLQYIDSQSQIKSKPPGPGISITPKNMPSGISLPQEVSAKDPKSLGAIPNEQPKTQARVAQEVSESIQKELNYGNYNVFQQQTGLNFKWAAEAQEDDFYKGLDRQVPSRSKNRDTKNVVKKTGESGNKVQDSGSKVNAMFADEEWEGISNAPSQVDKKPKATQNKPEVKKNTRVVKPEEVKKINPVVAPKVNSKPASVVSATSQTKKLEDGKENKSRNSGLVSKLQGQVKAASQQGVANNKGKKPPVKGGKRPDSPTTKCTRDTDLDVEEFLKDDFELLNKEEAHLQREILNMYQKDIGKVRAVEQKHNINLNYQNTQQYVNKTAPNLPPPQGGVSQNEDDLEESLERLDIILAKQRNAGSKPGSAPTNHHIKNQPQPQPPVYQKETSLMQQVMHAPQTNYQPISKPQPQYQPNIQEENPIFNPYRDPQPNPNLNNNYPQLIPQSYGSGYTNYPAPTQNTPYDPYYAAQQQQVYANINSMGQQEPVYSPEFGYNKGIQMPPNQQHPYYQPPQQYPPQYQQPNMNIPPGYPPMQQGQQGGYAMNMGGREVGHQESFGPQVMNNASNEYHEQLQLIYGNGLKVSAVPSQTGAGDQETDKMKTFSFGNNPGLQQNIPKANKEDDKVSVISSKSSKVTEQNMTMDRSVNEDKAGGYANKKQQQQPQGKVYGYGATKKPPAAGKSKEGGSNEEVVSGEGVKVVANADLKHLLFE